jgi:hypothetical protein
MTTATPDLPTVLDEAVTLVRDHVRAAVRGAEFRRLLRSAQAQIRSRGNEYNGGTVAALRAAFPEYAELLPARANITTVRVPADDAPMVAPSGEPIRDVDEDEEPCEDHEDGNAYCASCGGHPYERCSHDFECGECGGERSSCTECDLETDCDHRWMCGECEQPLILAGQVR